ncbi:MAG: hypothetical protein HDR11_08475 [Lachnospiraceae bacterium]|nr:hypothetical protein [Lachnospiraceae bacterium]
MIKKLTIKEWVHTGPLVLFLLAMGGFMLWTEGPSAIEAMQGLTPARAGRESVSTIYVVSAMGIFFVLLALLMLILTLKKSVKKRVNRYLAEHGEITMSMLESDFAAAEQVNDIWIGKRWTFNHQFDNIPLENDKIVWVHTDSMRSRRSTSYWICLGLVDGKEERASMPYKKLSVIMALYEKYPHILVSDGPEYSLMFKNNREALLDIKYRKAQADEYR